MNPTQGIQLSQCVQGVQGAQGVQVALEVEQVEHLEYVFAHRWAFTLALLLGDPLPPLPALPGRVHACRDAPLDPAELEGITSPTELGLLLGITKQAAAARLKARNTTTEGTP